jgi:FkbM family methyltransferase
MTRTARLSYGLVSHFGRPGLAIKTYIKNVLSALTANSISQRALERLVLAEQWLMGIGAGAVTETSGENAIVDLLRSASQRLERPLCIFDVGANKGQFLSMLLGGLRGVPAHLHAFEPGAGAFGALTAAHGNDTRLTLNHAGLGRQETSMTLYSDSDGSGIASLYRRRLDHFGLTFDKSETVSIDTLDAYCRRKGVKEIDLLKLDVEGHELDVLAGARESFERGRINMVTFEFGGCNIDSRSFLQDFFYFFKQYDSFDLFRITPTGYLAPVMAYREVYEQFRTTNYLARRR